ncbi:hydroxymethylglutaryl-CoA lyase [Polaromonas sp. SP1]|nr:MULTISPECIES: hydroxymethylglutaryl-CoA lyase [unclassified Polaromonas]AYQ28283.1 hydroxymethylglutaryl-CoA lyase [Polaromonas sp. SP1]QGJ20596.1 hydroxymethylglutaryl-CoA lyase [Polaromonas sp. Pch-P]
MKEHIKIVEVGPRDGLQNEAVNVDLETRLELIARLADAGVRHIESASFVSAKWVPQMAGSADLMKRLPRLAGVHYSALTPNLQGLESAIEAGCEEVAVFASASEQFSRRNINCTIRESLERFRSVVETARAHHIKVRGYVSCVLGCPYEGRVDPEQVAGVALLLHELGCHEISLGDTIGRGTPREVRAMLEASARRVPVSRLAGHFHDTYGMAIANIAASLEMGVRVFDSSVAGLGGCPYAAGASGNVATEDVIYLLHGMGYETGIDLRKIAEAGRFISQALGRESNSRVGRALLG